MKNLTKSLLALFAMGTIAASAIAQDAGPSGAGRPQGGPRGAEGGKMREKMVEIEKKVIAQLGLTEAQKAAIKKLEAENQAKMKKLMEEAKKNAQGGKKGEAGKNDPKREEMRKKMMELRKEREAGLTKIMGEKKYGEYKKLMAAEMKKLRAEMEKNGGKRGGGKPGGAKPGGSKP